MHDPITDQALTKKVALITGSSKRLGRAIALGLAKDGFDIALHFNRSSAEVKALKRDIEEMGRRAISVAGDLSDLKNAAAIVQAAHGELGALSLLVNNASLLEKDNLAGLTLESWRRLTDINLGSQVFLMQAFAAQPDLPVGASIINMLDQQMSAPSPRFFSYAIAKIGFEGATKIAAFDFAPRIRVNAIAPGLVLRSGSQTDATFHERQRQMPLGEGLSADDIVRAVRYLVASPHVTGEIMQVDSGQGLIGPGNSHLAPTTWP